MAAKLHIISELAAQSTQQLTQSVDNWKSFLNSAAWLYKYPFHEQVLIHAQRPDATACASMRLWNSRFGRWVNKGAKGIAVIDDSGDKPRLKYLFDVSDTNARHNAPFRLWHIKPEYEVQVIQELQNEFSETDSGSESLSDTILGTTINAVSDHYSDYCNDFLEAATDGVFADMDDEEQTAAFILQLVTGVSHIALVRLGIEPSSVLSEDDYAGILQFNSTGAINQLGAAVSDISELVLRQIERSVRSISRQQRGTLAKPSNALQNEADETERSDDDGNQLQQKWGLPDSQHSDGQSEPREYRQIRETAEKVPERESERVLQHADSDERPDRAPARNQQTGEGTDTAAQLADGAGRGRDRETESGESDALGTEDEQHIPQSRGNGFERTDLRITTENLFPTFQEQLEHIEEAEAQKLSAFSVSQADIDHELCRYGSVFSQGKFRIYKFFEGMPSTEAAVAFLKKEYGIGGHSHTYLNGESGFVDLDGKGLHFSNHNYEEKHTVTWRAVAQRLRELIAIDRYLTEEEKAYLPEYEAQETERRLQLEEESAARSALQAAAAAMDERRKNAGYAFSLGDTVQLGMTTYTILGYDETTVSLSDPKYPLFSEDMPRDVFEQRLRESPANDRLIAEAQEAEPQPEPVTKTVEVIPAEENHLPYDVVIQTIRAEEHESVKPAEKINFRITDDALGHGGIIAFVTSSGTMDKKNPSVRKYIAQRADLLGAVRLPNNAFLANAGTGVVADILFLQKRDRPIEIEPGWIHLGKTDGGFTINQYFADNPGMILGELSEESTQYGKQAVTVKPIAGAELPMQLSDAIANIHAEITEPEQLEEAEESIVESIPADPNVRNFSFAVVDGDIYYRENSVMHKVGLSVTAENRIKGMVKIRDCTRKLIEYQLEGYSDDLIRQEQQTLNRLYDEFTSQYGLLNSRANNTAFSDDSSYCLLCSLEVLDENGALVRKADMFSQRTIRQQEPITSCDTAADALAVSLSEKAKVDLQYMGKLTGKTEEQLTEDLAGIIFLNPSSEQYETADEYLSGDVRWKLRLLKEIDNPKYAANMEALEKVQPNDLTASEIDVRLGATWIPPEDIQRFVIELLKPAYYASSKIKVHYSRLTAQWNISGKTSDYGNVTANVTYGTKRINAYKIIEETLNLKDVRIFDTVYDESSSEKRVLNRNETVLAQQKQQLLKDAFRDWIWKDPKRREYLTSLYNMRFNSIRPREYDGAISDSSA